MSRLKDSMVYAFYGAAYYFALLCLRLSKLPAIGRPFEALGSAGRLRVVTVPVGQKIQSRSAILPFDHVVRLVEAASYVAIADSCLCRKTRGCKDYPISPGCIYSAKGRGPSDTSSGRRAKGRRWNGSKRRGRWGSSPTSSGRP